MLLRTLTIIFIIDIYLLLEYGASYFWTHFWLLVMLLRTLAIIFIIDIYLLYNMVLHILETFLIISNVITNIGYHFYHWYIYYYNMVLHILEKLLYIYIERVSSETTTRGILSRCTAEQRLYLNQLQLWSGSNWQVDRLVSVIIHMTAGFSPTHFCRSADVFSS